MFADELTKVKESENRAEEILKKAKLDSRQALENARTEAARIVEDAKNRGKETYDSYIRDGQSESDAQYEAYMAKTREECAAMIENARKKQQNATDYIAERIVRASVNH
ncbi:MAG: hypothetical protein ACI4LA_03635 [Emergencia sp.]